MGATRICVLALSAFSGCISFAEATYGGTCYQYYGVNATTCSDVYDACSYLSSCSYTNGKLSYYCYDHGCSGTWTQNSTDTIDVCQSVSFSTCEEADTAFTSIGCICSKCNSNANTGSIDIECYHPFNCSVSGYLGSENVDGSAVQILVYCIVAAVLMTGAMAISLCCTPRQMGEPSTKEIVRKKLSCTGRGIYRLVLASFVLEDGTPMRFMEYVCNKTDLFGLIACCKMPNLRPRWMRLGGLVGTLLVSISLAFIFGTFLYNNEMCSYSQDTCDGVPATVTCSEADGNAYIVADLAAILLSLGISEVSSLAISSVKVGSLRQKLQLAATLITATGLVIYGVLYSSSWSKGNVGDDYSGDSRRGKYIQFILIIVLVFTQIGELSLAICRFLMGRIFYSLVFRSRLEEEKKIAGAAAIYPQADQKINDAIIESGLDGSNQPETKIEAADEQNSTDTPEDITPDSVDSPKTTTEAADSQKPTSTPEVATPDSTKPTTEAADSQKPTSTPDAVTPDSAKTTTEAVDSQKPTSALDVVTPDSAKSPTTTVEGAEIQKPASTPNAATPGSANVPKATIEAVEIPKQVSTPGGVAPGSASSPKPKIGDEKSSFRFAGDKAMSARVDRKKVMTENIKLEPPKRGDHQ
ncbi:hypothetical protein KRP22_001777 [Phytophthora ramorum]|nr:hypothetical protein KRP22_1059 [Phytophthora ramorum]